MDTRFSSAIHTLILIAASEKPMTSEDIYQAVNETEVIGLFDLHQNPNDQCIVGHHIKPVLTEMFLEMEEVIALALSGKTLADCIDSIQNRIVLGKNYKEGYHGTETDYI